MRRGEDLSASKYASNVYTGRINLLKTNKYIQDLPLWLLVK